MNRRGKPIEAGTEQELDWEDMVSDQASVLWKETLAGANASTALDVGSLAFLRLADHLHEIEPGSIGPWLARTAESTLEDLSSEPWLTTSPFLGSSTEAFQELIGRAATAIDDRSQPGAVATPAIQEAAGKHLERYVSPPWRGGTPESDPLPTPDSLWQGSFAHDRLLVRLVLLSGQPRLMHGLVEPSSCRRARLRGSEPWFEADSHGRFRIEPIPPGPTSVEIDTGDALVTTEWVLL